MCQKPFALARHRFNASIKVLPINLNTVLSIYFLSSSGEDLSEQSDENKEDTAQSVNVATNNNKKESKKAAEVNKHSSVVRVKKLIKRILSNVCMHCYGSNLIS